MKYLIIPILLAITACASKPEVIDPIAPITPIIPQKSTQSVSGIPKIDLFAEAHRCQGIVKYQAEAQNGEIRSRLSCEWSVTPDQWGSW